MERFLSENPSAGNFPNSVIRIRHPFHLYKLLHVNPSIVISLRVKNDSAGGILYQIVYRLFPEENIKAKKGNK